MAAAVLAAALLTGPAGAAAPSGLRVTAVKGPVFPRRTFVLSLPGVRRLTTNDVRVTENGAPVAETSLVPASHASRKTFGVVLVLDASWSMRGRPILAALAAEQAFVARRNPNEQLGAVDFNRNVNVVLPLTTSAPKISAALASQPALDKQTHIFDAVAQAEAMLTQARVSSGSIIVLSDGADTGSTATLEHVAKVALANQMRIYTIGLADKSYRPQTLEALAAAGHGEYAQAKATALAPLFDQVSRRLSNEYLLRYKSLAAPKVPVRVDVSVRGLGTATTHYRTPSLPPTSSVASPPHQSAGNEIWRSPILLVVIPLLIAAAIALLVISFLRPRRSALPARMAEFISIRELQRSKRRPTAPPDADDKTPEKEPLWTRFTETLEIADIKLPPEIVAGGTAAATALVFVLLYVETGSPWWGVLALGIPYLARGWVLRTLRRRRNSFAEQLPDALQVIASALRSGHSFAGALAVVVESAAEPMKSEMQRVVADEQRGIPMQQSLAVVATRMASSDVEQLALVTELQREAGGGAAEVIDRVAETVRERFDLRRLVRTLTTQGRMSRWIVSALPLFIIAFLELENPHYLQPLLGSTAGKVVFALAAAWAVAGSLVIKRIVEIEV